MNLPSFEQFIFRYNPLLYLHDRYIHNLQQFQPMKIVFQNFKRHFLRESFGFYLQSVSFIWAEFYMNNFILFSRFSLNFVNTINSFNSTIWSFLRILQFLGNTFALYGFIHLNHIMLNQSSKLCASLHSVIFWFSLGTDRFVYDSEMLFKFPHIIFCRCWIIWLTANITWHR